MFLALLHRFQLSPASCRLHCAWKSGAEGCQVLFGYGEQRRAIEVLRFHLSRRDRDFISLSYTILCIICKGKMMEESVMYIYISVCVTVISPWFPDLQYLFLC